MTCGSAVIQTDNKPQAHTRPSHPNNRINIPSSCAYYLFNNKLSPLDHRNHRTQSHFWIITLIQFIFITNNVPSEKFIDEKNRKNEHEHDSPVHGFIPCNFEKKIHSDQMIRLDKILFYRRACARVCVPSVRTYPTISSQRTMHKLKTKNEHRRLTKTSRD